MKKVYLLLVLSIFLLSSCAQQSQKASEGSGEKIVEVTEGAVKEFTITARQFEFEPSIIEVNKGDKVKLVITSVDVPHGFKIEEYGINERLEPGKPVTIEFTADKQGSFTTFCSVACGAGHGSMKGKLIVK